MFGPTAIEIPEQVNHSSHAVIGAAIEVHRHLGPGYLESVYEDALAFELGLRGIPFERQVVIEVPYKGAVVGTHKLDFVVERHLIVELKTVEAIADIHRAQVLSYLKGSNLRLALLLNFKVARLRDGIHRVIL